MTWNLSVEVRSQATQLLATLRAGTQGARAMGVETEQTQRRIDALGTASATAARRVTSLAEASAAAAQEQRANSTQLTASTRRLSTLADTSNLAARGQRAAAAASTAFATQLRAASAEVAAATTRLAALGVTGERTAPLLRESGAAAESSAGRIGGMFSSALARGKSLAAFLAGGALLYGAADIVKLGNSLNSQMNLFQSTTNATGPQMARASASVKQLGSDLSLPASNAADAAEAMEDLAKAGFTADQAISADRAALTLQAGLHIKAANAAKYLGDTLDQYGLGADQAAKAADTLAGASTGASGGIQQIYDALKYAGPSANALHISLQDTAAAVVVLGKSGIIGQQAGTTIRTALVNMEKPTKQMQEGLDTLNITAFDSQGKFKGLAYVIGQLHTAQEKLSPQAFGKAVAQAYGKTGVSGITALSHQGLTGFTTAQQQVNQLGKAQALAASQSKGLSGAMTQLKTQAQTTGLTLYAAMAPALEAVGRGLTSGMAAVTPWAEKAINYGTELAQLFGPELAAKTKSGLSGLVSQASLLIAPLKAIGSNVAADGLNLLVNAGRALMTILQNLGRGLAPIGASLDAVNDGGKGAANSLDILVYAANAGLKAVAGLSGVLVPIGRVVGDLVHVFAGLPGPVQTAIAALLLASRLGPKIASSTAGATTGLRSLGTEIRTTQTAAQASGRDMTLFGASLRTLAGRVPVLSQMGTAFSTARSSAAGFSGVLSGSVRAASVGLKGALGGIMGVLGGPWGLVLTGATVGLGLLAAHQQAAAAAAQAHEQAIENLSNALRDSNGIVNDNVRATAAQALQDKKLSDGKSRLVDLASTAGVSLGELTNAYTDQGDSVEQLRGRLDALAQAQSVTILMPNGKENTTYFNDQAAAAAKLSGELGGMSGDFTKAQADALAFNAATKSSASANTAYGSLKSTVSDLANATGDADSRTRDLKQALDLLSGGSISLQAAEAKLNGAILDANASAASADKATGGWGKALVTTSGAINTTVANGQQLYNSLSDISDGATSAAAAAFTLAQNSGKTLTQSIAAATGEMTNGRAGAVKLANAYGITGPAAQKVADAMGLIPAQTTLILKTAGLSGALADLLAVQAQFAAIPGSKTIIVDTLTADAKTELQTLGYKVTTLPNRKIQITLESAAAKAGLAQYLNQLSQVPGTASTTAVAHTSAATQMLSDLGIKATHLPYGVVAVTAQDDATTTITKVQAGIDGLHGKTVNVNVDYHPIGGSGARASLNADGAIYTGRGVKAFANGTEKHVAQINPPGGPMRIWGEPETQGEAYVPLAATKRARSTQILGKVAKTFGYRLEKYANGGITGARYFADGGFSYTPSTPNATIGSPSDLVSTYTPKAISRTDYLKALRARTSATDTLRAAEARLEAVESKKHTHSALVGAETSVAKARLSVANATDAATAATNRYYGKFDLAGYAKGLASAASASAAWESQLSKIGKRAGSDVEDTLRGMGSDGQALVKALATASNKTFNSIVANLKKLGPEAQATLADYTAQLKTANAGTAAFQANLAKLSAEGYGSLALQLAGQGDDSAMAIAAQAVKSKGSAKSANAAALANAKMLDSTQLTELMQIIGAVKTSSTGIHAVAATTGLGEDEIITVGDLARAQIKSSLGSRSTRFLADLAKADKGVAYASGGMWTPGIYGASSPGLIKFAEPSTQGEAYLPMALSQRARATSVLATVAGRFGIPLGTAQSATGGAVIVVQQAAPVIGSLTIPVTTSNASAGDIATEVAWQARRARRGGVANR